MAFSFTTRLDKGKNDTGSINGLLDSLVSAIASALTTGAIATAQIADLAITTAKLAAGAVTTAKIGAAAVTGIKLDADSVTVWAVTGADASGGAQDLAANGAVVGLRIVEVINHTDGTVVDKSTITAGVDKFVLASGNLATKKLFIRTLPASA